MKHHPSCPDGFHGHELVVHRFLQVGAGAVDIWDDARFIAVADNRAIAQRIVTLLDRYGLVDVPDDASAITAPWPAPNPNTRQETP